MYLMSQDGKILVLLCALGIQIMGPNIYSIVHEGPGIGLSHVVLGTYSSLEKARKELSLIFDAVSFGRKYWVLGKDWDI